MTMEWNGDRILEQAMQAAIEGVTEVSRNAADRAAVLNAQRRYDTGAMAEGWVPLEVTVSGHVVSGGFENSVVDARSGFHYPALQDRGGRLITPANISVESIDVTFPTLGAEIAARMGVS